jgi:hypothetical protein
LPIITVLYRWSNSFIILAESIATVTSRLLCLSTGLFLLCLLCLLLEPSLFFFQELFHPLLLVLHAFTLLPLSCSLLPLFNDALSPCPLNLFGKGMLFYNCLSSFLEEFYIKHEVPEAASIILASSFA